MSHPASLAGIAGRGYAVVESLPSLGKGRSCTGLFTGAEGDRSALEALAVEGRRVPFQGMVHARHQSGEATFDVEVRRVLESRDGPTVEFATEAVPYDLTGGAAGDPGGVSG